MGTEGESKERVKKESCGRRGPDKTEDKQEFFILPVRRGNGMGAAV